MSRSGIEWTDETWNPVTGCSKVSPGCKHCYAEREWPRMTKLVQAYAGRDFTDVRTHADRLDQPLRWKRPRKVFVNSMSDLFHEDVPDEFIAAVFAVMGAAEHHTFQVLTKRSERMHSWFKWIKRYGNHWGHPGDAAREIAESFGLPHDNVPYRNWPLPNVWLGVSVEDQDAADERIPLLIDTPAAVRWISAEPLLGPVDLSRWVYDREEAISNAMNSPAAYNREQAESVVPRPLDWVVVGGESGPKARPMHPQWALDLRSQCAVAGVPLLLKQWGEWMPISQQTEELTNSLYVPNRKAKPHEDQRAIDELYGRRCKVKQTVQHLDGSLHHFLEPNAFPTGAMTTYRVGKKHAGRLLDGVLHDEYPVPAS